MTDMLYKTQPNPTNQGSLMAIVLDCGHEVSDLELQSIYYIHFRSGGCILQHINPYRLLNTKSCLFIYIK